jgi:hypothetical protein
MNFGRLQEVTWTCTVDLLDALRRLLALLPLLRDR